MNVTTWNQFGINDIILACLAMVGFLSVIVVIATAGKRMDKREKVLRTVRRLQNLEPEENVMDETRFGGTDPE
jgi:hypothetical protein